MKYSFLLLTLTAQLLLCLPSARAGVKDDDAKKNTYYVKFPKGKGTATLTSYMLGLSHPVTFIVEVKKGKKIKAVVKEIGDAGNIRINRFIFPDGNSTGPFGKTMMYPLNKKGIYKIIVGGSNMQGDDFKGAFTLKVTVT